MKDADILPPLPQNAWSVEREKIYKYRVQIEESTGNIVQREKLPKGSKTHTDRNPPETDIFLLTLSGCNCEPLKTKELDNDLQRKILRSLETLPLYQRLMMNTR